MINPTTFPTKLKAARQLKGYSLREVADLLNGQISAQAISKYEKGNMLPTSPNLLLLCEALEISLEFFNRPAIVLKEIEFRKLKKLAAKEQKRIEAAAADFMARYLELEDLVQATQQFKNPILENRVTSNEEVEVVVEKLRKKWQLGETPLLNVMELLEEKGIKIFPVEAPTAFNGMAAKTIINGQQHHLMVINQNKDIQMVRKRFTILHELAHIILDIPDELKERDKELLCHYFAGAMLISPEQVKTELGGKRHSIHLKELLAIKEQYGISMAAFLYRAKHLHYISDNYCDQQMRWFSKKGWLKKEPGEFCGKESSSRMLQLVCRGIEENLISLTKAANLYGMNLAAFRRFLNAPIAH